MKAFKPKIKKNQKNLYHGWRAGLLILVVAVCIVFVENMVVVSHRGTPGVEVCYMEVLLCHKPDDIIYEVKILYM